MAFWKITGEPPHVLGSLAPQSDGLFLETHFFVQENIYFRQKLNAKEQFLRGNRKVPAQLLPLPPRLCKSGCAITQYTVNLNKWLRYLIMFFSFSISCWDSKFKNWFLTWWINLWWHQKIPSRLWHRCSVQQCWNCSHPSSLRYINIPFSWIPTQ